ncbi:ATP-binding SpoIIE family protein phosphatase [Kineococcus arenarius]|uniref:ATP-binding SpoIIE family protein phosphatase n=1 Tax=Kineococcus sp. SYSU DK007 TaxID=3383128 RepID=UPI003D7DBC9B
MAIDASLLPAIFDGPAVAVIALDRDGLITALTPGAELLLGYSESELLGEPLHERLHHQHLDGSPLARGDCPVVAALRAARPAAGHGAVLARADGTLLVASWAFAPVVLARTLTGGVLTLHDVSAQRDDASRHGRRLALAEAANLRLTLLADVSQLLSEGPADLDRALDGLARRVVPALADWVAVDLLEADGARARRVALVHRDPAVEAGALAGLGPLPPLDPGMRSPLVQVLHGAPLQHVADLSTVDDEGDESWAQRRSHLRELGASAAIVAPLRARGRTLGALTLVRTLPARPFRDEDVAFVADLAARAAATVDTARLLQQEQHRAEQMQRALLPQLPERIGGLRLAGLYQPASDLAQVGGDWYDAFELPDGSAALVLGDVAGHDLHAATRMGAIRHKLRAIAADRVARPAEVLTRLDRVLQRFAPSDVATLLHARLRCEGAGWQAQWSSAGHPPPLLLVPGAGPRFLEAEADLPLGVADLPRHDAHASLPAGATVVFYSDGLVEHPGESLTDGLQRLLRAGAGLERAPLPHLCRELLDRLHPAGSDDIAVLAVHLGPVAAPAQGRAGEDGEALPQVHLLDLPLRRRQEFTQYTEGLLRELALLRFGARHPSATALPQRLLDLAAELQNTYAHLLADPTAVMDAASAAGRESCDVTYRVPAEAGPFAVRLLAALEEADDFCRAEEHLLTLPAAPEVAAYRRWVFGEFERQLAGAAPRPWRGPEPQHPPGPPLPPGGPGTRPEPDGEVRWRSAGEPLRLDPHPGAVSAARRHVRRTLRETGAGELEETAELGVSELVTNAVLHARTAVTVTVRLAPGGQVRIEVADSSEAHVQQRRFGPAAATGRGLRLVESISSAWGVEPLPPGRGPGKVVWFQPAPDAAGPELRAEDWAAELEGLL